MLIEICTLNVTERDVDTFFFYHGGGGGRGGEKRRNGRKRKRRKGIRTWYKLVVAYSTSLNSVPYEWRQERQPEWLLVVLAVSLCLPAQLFFLYSTLQFLLQFAIWSLYCKDSHGRPLRQWPVVLAASLCFQGQIFSLLLPFTFSFISHSTFAIRPLYCKDRNERPQRHVPAVPVGPLS